MKKLKKQIKKRVYLNSEETLLVISNYAQNRLFDSQKALKRLSKKQKMLVLAEQVGRKNKHSQHKNLIIDRVWTRNKPLSLLRLIPFIAKNDKIAHVLLQFHFKMFGRNVATNIAVPIVLLFLKLSKKRVYFEFHQVIDEKKIRKNTPIKSKIQRRFFNRILRLFYRSIDKLTNSIIVFKPSLKQALDRFIPEEQIILLPSTLVKVDRIKSSKQKEKNLAKTVRFYKSIVSTPYDIASNVSLNLK